MNASSVIPQVIDEYKVSFRDRVDAWKAEPSRGYDHREAELAHYWTERLLGYSESEYEHKA